jgi:pilus assembly protein Flp/PilA
MKICFSRLVMHYIRLKERLNEFKQDQRAVTAIEYGLIAVAVTVLIVVVFFYNNGVFVRVLGMQFTRLSEIIATVIK